jgi:hypothetical protein
MLSAMTLDQLGAKMVTINAASARSDTILQTRATRPGSFEAFRWHGPVPSRIRSFSPPAGHANAQRRGQLHHGITGQNPAIG